MTEATDQNQRRDQRLPVFMTAALANGDDVSVPCMVENVSENGICLESDIRLEVGRHITLSAGRLGVRDGIVRWAAHPMYGIEVTPAFATAMRTEAKPPRHSPEPKPSQIVARHFATRS